MRTRTPPTQHVSLARQRGFVRQKRPVLLDRVTDENTGKRVTIEKTATGPKAAAQLGMNVRSKASRPLEHALLTCNRT